MEKQVLPAGDEQDSGLGDQRLCRRIQGTRGQAQRAAVSDAGGVAHVGLAGPFLTLISLGEKPTSALRDGTLSPNAGVNTEQEQLADTSAFADAQRGLIWGMM